MRSKTMFIISVLVLVQVGNASAGLVAHYEFEGDFSDSSGHNLHGSPQNGASIIADPERGNVLSLTSNQYVDCGADLLFNITETITVTAWIKVNVFDKDSQAIVSKGGFWGLNRDGTNNGLDFSCLGLSPSNISGSKNVNDGQWHHVAGVYDRSELSLYVDGIVDASAAASGTISTTTGSLTVGVNLRLYPSYWNGLIDDVRIYDHALSPAQIAGLIGKMGTVYTYQGRLLDDNKPADGSFDLEFKLYDDPDSGTQQGSTITINQLDVIDGYFTVELDFGSGVFTGDPRWLEIGVRPGEFDDPNVYTVLSPRQMITPTPYALLALKGGDGHSLDAADGDPTDAVYVDNEGNVGIGTTSPSGSLYPDSTALEIAGNAPSIVLDDQWGIAQDDFEITNGGDKVLFRDATNGLDILTIMLTGTNEGNVGIGTTNPLSKLSFGTTLNPKMLALWDGINDFYGLGMQWGRMTFHTMDTEKMTILSTGNVGIGTMEPTARLEVEGPNDGIAIAKIDQQGVRNWTGLRLDRNDQEKWFIGMSVLNDKLLIRRNASSDDMVIDTTGNVGIGNMAPDEKLTVEGTIKSYASGPESKAVIGEATNPGLGSTYGGYFRADEHGVYGEATDADYLCNWGGYFKANAHGGRGVQGDATGEQADGVFGYATGKYGRGIRGNALGGSGDGVSGNAEGTDGCGVAGSAYGSNGTGVRGYGKAYDFYAYGPGNDYGSASSIRWKSNIQPINDPLGKVLGLRGVYFNWDAEHGGEHDIGMIAEEVGKVLPEIVVYEEDGINARGMDYGKLTPLLVEAVKALKEQIDQLQEQQSRKDMQITSQQKLIEDLQKEIKQLKKLQ